MNTLSKLPLLPPETSTIFWIRHQTFQVKSQTFYDLNTLMDGVLEKIYSRIEKSSTEEQWLQNFYLTGQSFNHPLHLFCINATQFRLKTELENIRSILKPKFLDTKELNILIIDETDTFKEEYFRLSDLKTKFTYLKN